MAQHWLRYHRRFRGWPRTKVVIISGFKEFEFARRAIEYNVRHYLLKPTKLEEIQDVFEQVKAKLDEERAQESVNERQRKRFKEWMPLLAEQFFTDLLTGVVREKDELRRRLDLLHLPAEMMDRRCAVIEVEIRQTRYTIRERESVKERVQATVVHSFNRQGRDVSFYPVTASLCGCKIVAEYLSSLRIGKAAELLLENKYKMYEIGRMVGYSNSKYFNRVFKLVTGRTPLQYCREQLLRGADQ